MLVKDIYAMNGGTYETLDEATARIEQQVQSEQVILDAKIEALEPARRFKENKMWED